MKEDILEQIAADYLNMAGYFTQTNIKYRPLETDLALSSDIDVIGFKTLHALPQPVVSVSFKSGQESLGAQWETLMIADRVRIAGGDDGSDVP